MNNEANKSDNEALARAEKMAAATMRTREAIRSIERGSRAVREAGLSMKALVLALSVVDNNDK